MFDEQGSYHNHAVVSPRCQMLKVHYYSMSPWKLTWITNSSPQACVGSQWVRTIMQRCAWHCWSPRSPKRRQKIPSRLKDHFFLDLHCCNIAATNEATKWRESWVQTMERGFRAVHLMLGPARYRALTTQKSSQPVFTAQSSKRLRRLKTVISSTGNGFELCAVKTAAMIFV